MKRRVGEIAQIVISIFITVAPGVDMVGRKARLVHVLTVVAGSLGAGIPLGRFIERKRRKASGAGNPEPAVEAAHHETFSDPLHSKELS